MTVLRKVLILTAMAGAFAAATPASAQFFFKSPDLSGAPVRGDEPGIVMPLPGATPVELRAGLVWTLRAGLNVAALQCQFDDSLLTVSNYNALLKDHADELQASLDTLTKYFTRTNKTKKAGQAALDQFGTRTYSGFSTVSGQYMFCQTAGSIGRDAIYAPRGTLGSVAEMRMRELRNSLLPAGEQRFPGRITLPRHVLLPNLADQCWKRDEWNAKKCGAPYPAG